MEKVALTGNTLTATCDRIVQRSAGEDVTGKLVSTS